MDKRKYGIKELCIFALFISVGIVLQYVEGLFAAIPVPGGKIGLANIVSILNIFMFGGVNAIIITATRAFLGSILTGGITAVPYSVTGAVVSVLIMSVCRRYFYPGMSVIGISVIGATAHNISQLFVASIFFSSGYVFSYSAPMLIIGLIGGVVTGYAAKFILQRYLGKSQWCQKGYEV